MSSDRPYKLVRKTSIKSMIKRKHFGDYLCIGDALQAGQKFRQEGIPKLKIVDAETGRTAVKDVDDVDGVAIGRSYE